MPVIPQQVLALMASRLESKLHLQGDQWWYYLAIHQDCTRWWCHGCSIVLSRIACLNREKYRDATTCWSQKHCQRHQIYLRDSEAGTAEEITVKDINPMRKKPDEFWLLPYCHRPEVNKRYVQKIFVQMSINPLTVSSTIPDWYVINTWLIAFSSLIR